MGQSLGVLFIKIVLFCTSSVEKIEMKPCIQFLCPQALHGCENGVQAPSGFDVVSSLHGFCMSKPSMASDMS